MALPNIKIIFIIFSIYFAFWCAEGSSDEDINGAEKLPSKRLLEIADSYDNQIETAAQVSPDKSIITSENIGRGIANTIYFSSPKSPMIIKKIFNPPANKTNYLLGDPISVYVEISSFDNDLSDLSVLEVIDDDFCVLNVSNDYGQISDIDAICEYLKELNRDSFSESEMQFHTNYNGCQIYRVNKTGVELKKDEAEYNLFDFNLSQELSSIEFDKLLKTLNKRFKISWAKNGSACYPIINDNKILIKRSNDVDFVKLNIDTLNKTAKLSINYDRSYEFPVRQDSKSIKINDTEISLKFSLAKLSKRDKFIYKYYIKPKRSGILNTMTLVRSWGRSDIESTSSIDVKDPNPIFEVVPRPKELYKLVNQDLEIIYDITYLGGASEPELNNTKLKFENDVDYCICNFEDGMSIKNFSFIKYRTEHIRVKANYKEEGTNPVPGIYINDKLYNLDNEKVTISTRLGWLISKVEKYSLIVSYFLGVASFALLVLFNITPAELIRKKFVNIMMRIEFLQKK